MGMDEHKNSSLWVLKKRQSGIFSNFLEHKNRKKKYKIREKFM